MSEPEPAAAPSAGRSFRPGDWFGIFGEHATVVLPPSEKARVAAIWALVDDGAGFDEVLDALIATGCGTCRASSWSARTARTPRS